MCSSTAIVSRPMRRDRSAPAAPPRSSVAISFGSPATESGVGRLDLNEILVRHSQAAFMMRISGDSMRQAGVCDGDLALVDRAVTAAHGHVVIAIVNDEFVCRRLVRRGQEVRLQCDGQVLPDWVPGDAEELQVWGVVTHVIRPLAA
jgi:DNA polymerase V